MLGTTIFIKTQFIKVYPTQKYHAEYLKYLIDLVLLNVEKFKGMRLLEVLAGLELKLLVG